MGDWAYPDTIKVDPYPLSDITTIPISLYVGEKDSTCAPERTYALAESLPTLSNLVTFTEDDHYLPFTSAAALNKLIEREFETGADKR